MVCHTAWVWSAAAGLHGSCSAHGSISMPQIPSTCLSTPLATALLLLLLLVLGDFSYSASLPFTSACRSMADEGHNVSQLLLVRNYRSPLNVLHVGRALLAGERRVSPAVWSQSAPLVVRRHAAEWKAQEPLARSCVLVGHCVYGSQGQQPGAFRVNYPGPALTTLPQPTPAAQLRSWRQRCPMMACRCPLCAGPMRRRRRTALRWKPGWVTADG